MESTRSYEQNVICFHHAILGRHCSAFDDRQQITLHPASADVGSLTAASSLFTGAKRGRDAFEEHGTGNVDDIIEAWSRWRDDHKVRANGGKGVISCCDVDRRPAKPAQLPWTAYGIRRGQEWVYTPFLLDSDPTAQPLAEPRRD